MNQQLVLGITPDVHGVGGMVSFRAKLEAGLKRRDVRLTTDLEDPELDAVLVIGGTRRLAALRALRRRGVRIAQRLDGMNWLHRKRWTGVRHFLRAEAGNRLLQAIRKRYADHIVYQSRFSRSWWEREHGTLPVPDSVVYNAVDLDQYTPDGRHERPDDHYRLLLVEGSLQGGYETGLETAVRLVQTLQAKHGLPARLSIAGKSSGSIVKRYEPIEPGIEWLGLVPGKEIPALDRSAHVLFSGDIHAACPNSVIEALACGLPVAAFDTGSLAELVDSGSGCIVPYGGDPWALDPPDTDALANACAAVLRSNPGYRKAARARAEALFGLESMLDGYEEALFNA